MPYCGRPSKACARCRVRRLKCDFGRPHCRKCQSAGVLCSGYRNEQDLIFRDVTAQIIDRHPRTPMHFPNTCDKPISSREQSLGMVREPSSQDDEYLFDENILDVALTFLFKCYLRGSSFEWVAQLYHDTPSSRIFTNIVHATALAVYSHESRRVRILTKARTIYNYALLELREAIRSTDSATDTTLASILLMSRFETLLNDGSERSITENWSNHVFGAFAIVQAREERGNYKDAMSYTLMEQTIHNYNLYCLKTGSPRPPTLVAATDELCERMRTLEGARPREMRLRFHKLVDELSEFRRLEKASSAADALKLVRRAQEILALAMQYQAQLASVSTYKTLPVSGLIQQFGRLDFRPYADVYHIYQNHHEARLWNGVRMLRLGLHDSIYLLGTASYTDGTLSRPSSDNEVRKELQHAVTLSVPVMAELVTDICASAPQFLRAGISDCTHAAAFFLAWPLFLAGRSSGKECKEFVSAALKWIGHELNIKSAQMAAENLDKEEYQDDWLQACYMF